MSTFTIKRQPQMKNKTFRLPMPLLEQLERMNRMDGNDNRRRRSAYEEDDLWEEPPRSGRRKGSGHMSQEDLDYRHMEVLEFEDDEYCYYVEAVPKRGGRRG